MGLTHWVSRVACSELVRGRAEAFWGLTGWNTSRATCSHMAPLHAYPGMTRCTLPSPPLLSSRAGLMYMMTSCVRLATGAARR